MLIYYLIQLISRNIIILTIENILSFKTNISRSWKITPTFFSTEEVFQLAEEQLNTMKERIILQLKSLRVNALRLALAEEYN